MLLLLSGPLGLYHAVAVSIICVTVSALLLLNAHWKWLAGSRGHPQQKEQQQQQQQQQPQGQCARCADVLEQLSTHERIADSDDAMRSASHPASPCGSRCCANKVPASSWVPETFPPPQSLAAPLRLDQHYVQPPPPPPPPLPVTLSIMRMSASRPRQACTAGSHSEVSMSVASIQADASVGAVASAVAAAVRSKFSGDGSPAATSVAATSGVCCSKHMDNAAVNSDQTTPASNSPCVTSRSNLMDTASRPDNTPSAYDTARAIVARARGQSYTPVFMLGRVALKIPDRHPSDMPPAAVWTRPYREALQGEGIALVGAYVREGCIHIVVDFLDLGVDDNSDEQAAPNPTTARSSPSCTHASSEPRLLPAPGDGQPAAADTAGSSAFRTLAASLAVQQPRPGRSSAPGLLLPQGPVVDIPPRQQHPQRLQPQVSQALQQRRRSTRRNAPVRVWSADAAVAARNGAGRLSVFPSGSRVSHSQSAGMDGDTLSDSANTRPQSPATRRLRQSRRASSPLLSPAAQGRLGVVHHEGGSPGRGRLGQVHHSGLGGARGGEAAGAGAAGAEGDDNNGGAAAAASAAEMLSQRLMQSVPPGAWVQLLGEDLGGGGRGITVQMPHGGGMWDVQWGGSGQAAQRVMQGVSPPDLICISPPCVLAGAAGPLIMYAAGTDLQAGGGSGGDGGAGSSGQDGSGGSATAAAGGGGGGGPLAVHVRYRGAYQPCRASLLGDQMPAEALSRVLPMDALRHAEVLCLQLPRAPALPGLMFVECQRDGILGAALPVLVAPNPGVWQEVASLSNSSIKEGGGQTSMAQRFVQDLGLWLDYLATRPPQPARPEPASHSAPWAQQQQQELLAARQQPYLHQQSWIPQQLPQQAAAAARQHPQQQLPVGSAGQPPWLPPSHPSGFMPYQASAAATSMLPAGLRDAAEGERIGATAYVEQAVMAAALAEEPRRPDGEAHGRGLSRLFGRSLLQLLNAVNGDFLTERPAGDDFEEAATPPVQEQQPGEQAQSGEGDCNRATEGFRRLQWRGPAPSTPPGFCIQVGVDMAVGPPPAGAAAAGQMGQAGQGVLQPAGGAVVDDGGSNNAYPLDKQLGVAYGSTPGLNPTPAAAMGNSAVDGPDPANLARAISDPHTRRQAIRGQGAEATAAVADGSVLSHFPEAAAELCRISSGAHGPLDVECNQQSGGVADLLLPQSLSDYDLAHRLSSGVLWRLAALGPELATVGYDNRSDQPPQSVLDLQLSGRLRAPGFSAAQEEEQPQSQSGADDGRPVRIAAAAAAVPRSPPPFALQPPATSLVLEPLSVSSCSSAPPRSGSGVPRSLSPGVLIPIDIVQVGGGPSGSGDGGGGDGLPPVRMDSSGTELRSWDSFTEIMMGGSAPGAGAAPPSGPSLPASLSRMPSPPRSPVLRSDSRGMSSHDGDDGGEAQPRASSHRAVFAQGSDALTSEGLLLLRLMSGEQRTGNGQQNQLFERMLSGGCALAASLGGATGDEGATAVRTGGTYSTAAATNGRAGSGLGRSQSSTLELTASRRSYSGKVASGTLLIPSNATSGMPSPRAGVDTLVATLSPAARPTLAGSPPSAVTAPLQPGSDPLSAPQAPHAASTASEAAAAAAIAALEADLAAHARWPVANHTAAMALASRMETIGVGLLAFSVQRGWVHTTLELLSGLGQLGLSLAEMDAAVAAREGGMGLLHLAVIARPPALLRVLLQVGAAGAGERRGGSTASEEDHLVGAAGLRGMGRGGPVALWDLGAPGPAGLTPLHLATALEDGGQVAWMLLESVPEAARLWFTVGDDGGSTPADMATQARLEGLNQLARMKLTEMKLQLEMQQRLALWQRQELELRQPQALAEPGRAQRQAEAQEQQQPAPPLLPLPPQGQLQSENCVRARSMALSQTADGTAPPLVRAEQQQQPQGPRVGEQSYAGGRVTALVAASERSHPTDGSQAVLPPATVEAVLAGRWTVTSEHTVGTKPNANVGGGTSSDPWLDPPRGPGQGASCPDGSGAGKNKGSSDDDGGDGSPGGNSPWAQRAAVLVRVSVHGWADPRVEWQYRQFRATSLSAVDATCGIIFTLLFLLPALGLARQRDWPELLTHCIFNAGLLGPYMVRTLAPRAFLRHRDLAILMGDSCKALLVLLTLTNVLEFPRVWANFSRGNMDVIMLMIIKPLSEQIVLPVAVAQRLFSIFADMHIYAHVTYGGAIVPSIVRAVLQNTGALLLLLLLDVRARLSFEQSWSLACGGAAASRSVAPSAKAPAGTGANSSSQMPNWSVSSSMVHAKTE